MGALWSTTGRAPVPASGLRGANCNLNHGFRWSDALKLCPCAILRLPEPDTKEKSSLMILSAWPPKATLGSAPKSPQHIFVNIQFNEILAMEAPWRP